MKEQGKIVGYDFEPIWKEKDVGAEGYWMRRIIVNGEDVSRERMTYFYPEERYRFDRVVLSIRMGVQKYREAISPTIPLNRVINSLEDL